MKLSRERVGELCILLEAALWGLFPVITILSFGSLPVLVSLGWSTLFAAFFFGIMLTVRRKWADVFNRSAALDILLTAFILGFVYYLLFFAGLEHTSAGNASIVSLSEVFFSYCFFNLLMRERMSPVHIAGAGFMLLGAGIVLYPSLGSLQIGDLFILAAALIAPVGNLVQRRARAKVSSESILFVRSILSAPAVFFLAYVLGTNPFQTHFDGGLILLIALNGIVLFGFSKILWIEGIHRINVAKANALGSLSPLVTLLCAYVILGTAPTLWQIIAFIPVSIGVFLLSRDK